MQEPRIGGVGPFTLKAASQENGAVMWTEGSYVDKLTGVRSPSRAVLLLIEYFHVMPLISKI